MDEVLDLLIRQTAHDLNNKIQTDAVLRQNNPVDTLDEAIRWAMRMGAKYPDAIKEQLGDE